MKIPERITQSVVFQHLERIEQAKRSKISGEVLVRFVNTSTRNLFQSYAPNFSGMAGEAGIRLSVPDHLRGLFRMFEIHGGNLKQQYKDGLKRSIKLDDESQSIIMDVKLPGDDEWIRLTSEDVVQVAKERNQENSAVHLSKQRTTKGERMRKALLKRPGEGATIVESSDEESSRTA